MLGDAIYLDYCATTPADQEVVAEMLPYFTEFFGNASSKQHVFGWKAAAAADAAKKQVAALIGAVPEEIIFTSGATESCNLALRGIANLYKGSDNHIITTKVEHKAVLDTCKVLEKEGTEITYLDVDAAGIIDLEALKTAIKPNTILIAINWANNETGVIMPVNDIGKIAKAHNVLFFSDATQAVGKIPVDVSEAALGLMAFSGHKMYGPKGVGVLYRSRRNPRVRLVAQITGGGQQDNARSGTLNIPGIVGMGKAAALCKEKMEAEQGRLMHLRRQLESALLDLPETFLNGAAEQRLPHVVNISFGYLSSSDILAAVGKEIAVSSGSACTSGSLDPSYVLMAMHGNAALAKAAIRFSPGRFTTSAEIEHTINVFKELIPALRSNSPAWQFRS